MTLYVTSAMAEVMCGRLEVDARDVSNSERSDGFVELEGPSDGTGAEGHGVEGTTSRS